MNAVEIAAIAVPASVTFITVWAGMTRWMVEVIPYNNPDAPEPSTGDWAFAAYVSCFLMFLSPIIGVGAYVIWLAKGAPGWRRLVPRRKPKPAPVIVSRANPETIAALLRWNAEWERMHEADLLWASNLGTEHQHVA